MIRVRAEAERNINSAAAEKNKKRKVKRMVELDQFKYILGTYEKPLVEVRDSL